jgi:hypothetical protein
VVKFYRLHEAYPSTVLLETRNSKRLIRLGGGRERTGAYEVDSLSL